MINKMGVISTQGTKVLTSKTTPNVYILLYKQTLLAGKCILSTQTCQGTMFVNAKTNRNVDKNFLNVEIII